MSASSVRAARWCGLAGLVFAVFAVAAGPAAAQAPTPCRVPGLKNEVLCGHVVRPLDPARPQGPTLEVHYVVVPATARRKLPDPVVLLAGGPGQSAIDVGPAVFGLFTRLNNRRDIVFVDQRGTGRSAPLDCEDDRHETLAERLDLDSQVRRQEACRDRLARLPYVGDARGLGFFTTTIAMQDLDAVRAQLGVARWNLVGASYGTRAALEYMRQFPQAVRRVVLDGVAPPDMVLPASQAADAQAALDAAFAACAAEPVCAQTYPELRGQWDTLLASLPRRVSVRHPSTGRTEDVVMTREMLMGAVRGPLYLPALAAGLPAAISAAARGDFDGLVGLSAQRGVGRASRIATGMHFSVTCAEDVPGLVASPVGPAGGIAELYRRVCATWPRGEVPAEFYRVPPFPRPVLLLSGGIDPATPPRHGTRVVQALGHAAKHVVVPNAGHGVLGLGWMREVLYRFFDAGDDAAAGAIDAACAVSIPRPPAFVPMGAASGVAR